MTRLTQAEGPEDGSPLRSNARPNAADAADIQGCTLPISRRRQREVVAVPLLYGSLTLRSFVGGGMALSFRRILACLGFATLLPAVAAAQEPAARL